MSNLIKCRVCGRELPPSEFYNTPAGHKRGECRHCYQERQAKRRNAAQESRKEILAKNRAARASRCASRKVYKTCEECVNIESCRIWGRDAIESNLALTCRGFKNKDNE